METMLNESELLGTGSVPSHRQRLNGRLLTLPVANASATPGTPASYVVRAYSNATLFDVRSALADKLVLPVSRVVVRVMHRRTAASPTDAAVKGVCVIHTHTLTGMPVLVLVMDY